MGNGDLIMQKWSGQNYMGTRLDDYFVLITRNRDSGVLEESNWRSIIKHLKKVKAHYKIVSFNHWAVGWIEEILIKDSWKKSILIGNEIQEKLENYPVFNDEDFSDLEWDKAGDMAKEIRNDINNLSPGDKLYWGDHIKPDMTDEQIIDTIMEYGMIES